MKTLTGLVLAGGQGRRMGQMNKGLLPWGEESLAEHAVKELGKLSSTVYISANADLDRYRQWAPVIEDVRPNFCGPLAAIEAALAVIETPWLLTLPCDTPFVMASDLAQLLQKKSPNANAAYLVCGANIHPLAALVKRDTAPLLKSLLDRGERRVIAFWQALNAEAIDLGEAQEIRFKNLNTPEDFAAARNS